MTMLAVGLGLCFTVAAGATVVNDVTQLNPVHVDKVVAPKSAAEVAKLVKEHSGPICIGGGRYSMGGQIATEGCLFLDMRELNRVLEINETERWLRVEAGATWRHIQENIDPKNLSVKIMQSYSNFTVGGSLSVNVHGRYVGHGPLIGSVRSLKLVTADGTLVEASPMVRSDLFYGAIGGYGGLGVIVEAVLELAENKPLVRKSKVLPTEKYRDYFFEEIRDAKTAVFHNGDLYAPNFDTVRATTFFVTERPVTSEARLQPIKAPSWMNRFALFLITEVPGGQWIRKNWLDPILFRGEPVLWRNYEASLDVSELEPSSRTKTTYVLEEYFVPVRRFDEFVPKMANIFKKHGANVLNVSIRHATPDPGALMAWAREEVFAFVVYYKQGTDVAAREKVGEWTRELVDAVLACGGTYYLPYQPHATIAQFQKAYPKSKEYFALKSAVDPQYRFRNKLWDKYYAPTRSTVSINDETVKKKLKN